MAGLVAALSALAPRAATSPADPHATQAAKDLASLLDGFSASRTMAVGQQLNVNGDDPFGPVTALDALADRVRVLGLDHQRVALRGAARLQPAGAR